MTTQTTAKSRYDELVTDREPFLDRAQTFAKYTLPSLFPPDGHNPWSSLEDPWQSVGGRGVNNLASKLLMALLPPNEPFFRHIMTEDVSEEAASQGATNSVEQALAKIDRIILREIEKMGLRASVFEAIKQVIVGGTASIDLREGVKPRTIPMTRFVSRRDGNGSVLEFLTVEYIHKDSVPDGVDKSELPDQDDKVALYTWLQRRGKKGSYSWEATQHVEDQMIPGTRKTYKIFPYLLLRMDVIDGEDYGRSYCDNLIGDLRLLENLSFGAGASAVAAARSVRLVDPNGVTRAADLEQAAPGDYVAGRDQDVTPLNETSALNISAVQQMADTITRRLDLAFLNNFAIQRAGERVTAEEIRRLANELEQALGGVYSALSTDFQLRLVEIVTDRLSKEIEKFPSLKSNGRPLAEPVIVTGVDALGRTNDLSKDIQFAQILQNTFGPEALDFISPDGFATRLATNLGIDPEGLIRTPQEQQELQRQRLAAQLAQQAAGPVAGAAASAAAQPPQEPTEQ